MIAAELPAVEKVAAEVRPRTEGKTAMLFVGGSRAHHYQELFGELGMVTVAAGYEFGHRDDYEGRKIIPTIKVDADYVQHRPVRLHRPGPALGRLLVMFGLCRN